MGQSCCGMSGPCPECWESCGDNCHRDEPCMDRCCNLCCQFCLDGCCLICSDDCRYTLCFTCTRIADSCTAVLTTQQPRTTQKPREGSTRMLIQEHVVLGEITLAKVLIWKKAR